MGWLIALLWCIAWVGTPIVASTKHRSVGGWLALGILFGLFAFVVILLLPPLADAVAIAHEQVSTRVCPSCLSRIPRQASVCRYCQRDVPAHATPAGTAYTTARPEDRI